MATQHPGGGSQEDEVIVIVDDDDDVDDDGGDGGDGSGGEGDSARLGTKRDSACVDETSTKEEAEENVAKKPKSLKSSSAEHDDVAPPQAQSVFAGSSSSSSSAASTKLTAAKRPTVITKPGLRLRQWKLFSKEAFRLFAKLEASGEVDYYPKSMTRVQVFGKWHETHRRTTAYGDAGLAYSFSGCRVPCKPWTPLLLDLKTQAEAACQPPKPFNFVLVNRYKDGADFIGKHRDDERELDAACPIASLTFGQTRDFVLHHAHVVQKRGKHTKMVPVTVTLASGTLLTMDPPTNTHWYHSVPKRAPAKVPGVRINLTFRRLDPAKAK
ncbi:Alkbh2 protein [Salpingoeca rosetta]|uniref:DNA oxidative demethylase ALKBH2 n=1 Tax=Salpingoeca rosetta (strain ATCC 50818 / BSB-021) TaxID=946362 RepID=F2UFI5_SALR5|nr:Alkbh2 protein [Salpingoeca rosetta]EGD75553.1 Alkbh2 protein [Salpingoeca rosetta]|eukprot:XP_004992010.1 Alkbh2 protein [Salpingoeca rosetta]